MRFHHLLSMLVFGLCVFAYQPASAAETPAADNAGPTINISKITFKNIHPDVNGYQLDCQISTYDYKTLDKNEWEAMSYGTVARVHMEDKTFFSADSSRRKSSEVGPLKLVTKIEGIVGKKITKDDLLKAKSWFCYASHISKSSIGEFKKTNGSVASAITADSTAMLSGKF